MIQIERNDDMTYWIYTEKHQGRKFLQTTINNFAGAISYLTRTEYYIKERPDGTIIYSFIYDEEIENTAKFLIKMKNENYSKKSHM